MGEPVLKVVISFFYASKRALLFETQSA